MGAECGLDSPEREGDRLKILIAERPGQGRLGSLIDRVTELTELLEAAGEGACVPVGGELGDRRVEGDENLKGGLTPPPVVEVEAGAERQLLAGQGLLTSPEQGGETGLGREDPAPALAPDGQDELPSLAPEAVGDLLAAAIANPCHEELMAPQGGLVRVAGSEPEGVERSVEDRQVGLELLFARGGKPGGGLPGLGERAGHVDDRPSARGDESRVRLRLNLNLSPTAIGQGPPLRRSQRGDHQHVRRGRIRAGTELT